MQSLVPESDFEKLYAVAKAFYQAYHLSGTLKVQFGFRSLPDSDGSNVIDVYVSPQDQQAADTLAAETNARHMQFLESMVPAAWLGYQFILQIIATGPDEVAVEVLHTIEPSGLVTAL